MKVDQVLWGYMRLVWLFMDGLCAFLGSREPMLSFEVAVYNPLHNLAVNLWIHEKGE